MNAAKTPVSCCHVWRFPFAAPAGAKRALTGVREVLRKRKEIVMLFEML